MEVIKKEIKDNFSLSPSLSFTHSGNICFLSKRKMENTKKAKDKFKGFLHHQRDQVKEVRKGRTLVIIMNIMDSDITKYNRREDYVIQDSIV